VVVFVCEHVAVACRLVVLLMLLGSIQTVDVDERRQLTTAVLSGRRRNDPVDDARPDSRRICTN